MQHLQKHEYVITCSIITFRSHHPLNNAKQLSSNLYEKSSRNWYKKLMALIDNQRQKTTNPHSFSLQPPKNDTIVDQHAQQESAEITVPTIPVMDHNINNNDPLHAALIPPSQSTASTQLDKSVVITTESPQEPAQSQAHQLDESILAYIDQSLRKFKEVGYFNTPSTTSQSHVQATPAAVAPVYAPAERHGSYNELHDMFETHHRRPPFFDSVSSIDRVQNDTNCHFLFPTHLIAFPPAYPSGITISHKSASSTVFGAKHQQLLTRSIHGASSQSRC